MDQHTITIWPTETSEGEKWHWKRETPVRMIRDAQNYQYEVGGAQIDGSGPQRNGFKSRDAVLKEVRKKYPDDKVM